MKIQILWSRKLGHLWQSLATDRTRQAYGYGTTRREASNKARQALTKKVTA